MRSAWGTTVEWVPRKDQTFLISGRWLAAKHLSNRPYLARSLRGQDAGKNVDTIRVERDLFSSRDTGTHVFLRSKCVRDLPIEPSLFQRGVRTSRPCISHLTLPWRKFVSESWRGDVGEQGSMTKPVRVALRLLQPVCSVIGPDVNMCSTVADGSVVAPPPQGNVQLCTASPAPVSECLMWCGDVDV